MGPASHTTIASPGSSFGWSPRAFFRWALDDVEPALAVLELGHERLRPFQPFRDIMLGQPRLLASRDQQLAEGALPERVDDLPMPRARRGTLFDEWAFPPCKQSNQEN
jgi:hypothetical protein